MPKELGVFLNSTNGLWTLLAIMAVFLVSMVPVVKRVFGKEYLGQSLVLLGMLYLAGIFFLLSLWFRPPRLGGVPSTVIPRLWIVGIVLVVAYLFSRIITKTEEHDPASGDLRRVLRFSISVIIYLIVMVYLGYYISSFLYLVYGMWSLSYRRWPVILGVTVVWVAASYFVFYRLLYVSLPRGLLIIALFGR
jgi:hypothetical protein